MLPDLDAIKELPGCSLHIRNINQRLAQADLWDTLDQYFATVRPTMKESSFNSFLYAIRRAVLNAAGPRIRLDPQMQTMVDHFFRSYRLKTHTQPAGHALRAAELRTLTECSATRTSLWVRFLAHGLRVSEACGIRMTDIEQNDRESGARIILVRGKGARYRRVRLPPDLMDDVTKEFRGTTYLFETTGGHPYRRQDVNLIVTASKKHLGFHITPHDLRRTFATLMATRRPDLLKAILDQGGWSNPRVFLDHYVRQTLDPRDVMQCLSAD